MKKNWSKLGDPKVPRRVLGVNLCSRANDVLGDSNSKNAPV